MCVHKSVIFEKPYEWTKFIHYLYLDWLNNKEATTNVKNAWMTNGSLLNFIPPRAGWSSGVRTLCFLAGTETFPWYILETWHVVCCVCSDWKRDLAICSVAWRRKSWRFSTKGRRRRWYISFLCYSSASTLFEHLEHSFLFVYVF